MIGIIKLYSVQFKSSLYLVQIHEVYGRTLNLLKNAYKSTDTKIPNTINYDQILFSSPLMFLFSDWYFTASVTFTGLETGLVKKYLHIFVRPGVAGAVLHTPLGLTD